MPAAWLTEHVVRPRKQNIDLFCYPPLKEGNSTSLRKVLSPRNKIFSRALNIEHKYLYLRPSLATFNHMKIFFGEWRLYIYLRPLLATTINIWTLTQSLYHNFICFMFQSNSMELWTSKQQAQRWIDTILLEWYIWFGLLHLQNAI